MGSFTIFAMLILISRYARCDSNYVNVSEGEIAHLYFSYPCNSTRVTLQYANRLPFYSSANPEVISIPENHNLTIKNESQSDQCSVFLTINPVLRDNEGTYILTAYKNGRMLPDYPRIRLQVNYPPGKALCKSSNDYNDGEWGSLQCKAPVGNLAGQIVCYQNDMRLPSLTSPVENRETLNQAILVRLGDPVFCCACTSDKYTESSECRDCAWDPIQDIALTNFRDPHPTPLSTQDPTPSNNFNTDPTFSSDPQTVITGKPNHKEIHVHPNNSLHWQYIEIGILTTMIIILAALYFQVIKVNKNFSKGTNNIDVKVPLDDMKSSDNNNDDNGVIYKVLLTEDTKS